MLCVVLYYKDNAAIFKRTVTINFMTCVSIAMSFYAEGLPACLCAIQIDVHFVYKRSAVEVLLGCENSLMSQLILPCF